jgi:hypothetical protein
MQINLEITFADGTKKAVNAIAADLVAFESKFDLSIARLEQNVKLTHLLFLAWHCEFRTKATQLEFEAWLDIVESIQVSNSKK